LLITFDDGWRDNAEYALPLCERAGLPAVIFVTSDAVDADEIDPFWPEQVIQSFRRGRLTPVECVRLWHEATGDTADAPAFTTLAHCRRLVAALTTLDPVRLGRVLEPMRALLAGEPGQRQLLTTAELRDLATRGFAVGAHGKSHRPLGRVADPGTELRESRRVLAEKLGHPPEAAPATMAFPHGSYTASIVKQARAAGFQRVFTSDHLLNPIVDEGGCPALLGRASFNAADISDGDGRLRPELLALRLFRAPHATLEG
jgi:peptidoglycan/xylan/chitin deacetylase (PgdA/CDA1 family)